MLGPFSVVRRRNFRAALGGLSSVQRASQRGWPGAHWRTRAVSDHDILAGRARRAGDGFIQIVWSADASCATRETGSPGIICCATSAGRARLFWKPINTDVAFPIASRDPSIVLFPNSPMHSTTSPASSAPTCHPFRFREARALIADLQVPDQKIYWADFLASILAGHVAIHLIFMLPWLYGFTPWVLAGMTVSYVATVILYMRALMFIHELVHLPEQGFTTFRVAWNALCGIFFLVPSFMYYPHVDHHRRKHYGTEHDGEYLALSHRGPWMIIGFILQALIIPFLALFRFTVISPLCWVFPRLRPFVHRHLSTMVVDPFYERRDASPKVMRVVIMQEVLCFAWCVWFLVRGGILRDQPLDPFWLIAYAVGVGILVLNEVRTLGAHRWTNDGGEMTFDEQLLDSVNYPEKPWLTELWGPVGTRYHALHHLFPRLPYHNLGEAHRRLSEGLPEDSPYHRTSARSLTSEIVALWRRAKISPSDSDSGQHPQRDVAAGSSVAA